MPVWLAASSLGAAITMPVCGFLLSTLGWESTFYVTGVVGLAWSLLWFMLIFDSPAQHPRITAEERRFIEQALGSSVQSKGKEVSWSRIEPLARGVVPAPSLWSRRHTQIRNAMEQVLWAVLAKRFPTHSRSRTPQKRHRNILRPLLYYGGQVCDPKSFLFIRRPHATSSPSSQPFLFFSRPQGWGPLRQ